DEASAGLGGRAAEAHVDIERDLDVPGERLAIEVLDELIRQLPLLELTHPDSGVQKHAPPVLQANDEMDVVLPAGLQKRMADVAEIDEEPCAAPGLVDDQLGTVVSSGRSNLVCDDVLEAERHVEVNLWPAPAP